MFVKLGSIITILSLSTISSLMSVTATHAEPMPKIKAESIPELFDRAFFYHSENAFDSSDISSQINTIIGAESFLEGSYPENQINRDARLVHILYRELLEVQLQSQPPIRTRDLPNPFDSFLIELGY